jgi:hypothetical protein
MRVPSEKSKSVGSSQKGSGGFLVKARGVVANITRRFNFYARIVQQSTCKYSTLVHILYRIYFRRYFDATECVGQKPDKHNRHVSLEPTISTSA